ncbi:MAG: ice-binding family protein, partial [Aeromicrobium sp.]
MLTATGMTAIIASAALFFAQPAQAVATAVPLGTAESFSVLAGAGITNSGPTVLAGDLGTYPTTSVTGTSTLTVLGTDHGGDAVTQGAKTNLIAAYNNAAGQAKDFDVTADLGGQTLPAGVYNSASTMGLTGQLTLNGGPDAVWVFQIGSGLTTATDSSIILTGGALACNVYWQIGSSATLGTRTKFVGTLIALTDISLGTGATVEGRMLARNGAVTMLTNTITKPGGTPGGDTTGDATGDTTGDTTGD